MLPVTKAAGSPASSDQSSSARAHHDDRARNLPKRLDQLSSFSMAYAPRLRSSLGDPPV
jgi:hypothetical protein